MDARRSERMVGGEAAVTGAWRTGLARLFDRVAGIPDEDAAFRADMLDTAMLRPLGLATASVGFMMMSGAALALTGSVWAAAWLGADLAMLVARLPPAIRAWRTRTRIPEGAARVILAAAFVMFATFGMGCAASFSTGIEALRIASTVALMGLVAGLATRWAALPRLAAALVALAATPMTIAIGQVSALAAALFATVVAGTAVLTLQNNRTLVAMLRAERTARRLASTDQLTGLLNRAGFHDALERRCPDAAGADDVAVLFLDLDGFKAVNDRHGHAAGDLVLAETGRRLRLLAGDRFAARLGGDEFVLVLAEAADGAPEAFADGVRERLERPVAIEQAGHAPGTTVRVGVSLGIARGSLADRGPAALLADADHALYAAKRAATRRGVDGLRAVRAA